AFPRYSWRVIDLRTLRENPDLVRQSQIARGDDPGIVDTILEADVRRRTALSEFEALRARQKSIGKDVARASGSEKDALLTETKQIAAKVKELNQVQQDANEELNTL